LITTIKITEVKVNPNNPRIIKDDKFKKLVQSIKDFPEMLNLRPIVVNGDMVVLGGNMRLKACKEAGLKEVPIIKAEDLTEDQQREFIIKDNVGFGEWDWDEIANNWDAEQLDAWGLNLIQFKSDQYFEIDDKSNNDKDKPSATNDNYSTFELIMLHENKLILLEALNKIKSQYLFEKQEESLMELIRIYNKQ
jgi:ParB-like chromosome segregation protein Spo0J